jgi:hypothetical protein
MVNGFNETYIGTSNGQLKDDMLLNDNIITKTIKLDATNCATNSDATTSASNICVGENNNAKRENIVFWIDDPSILFSKKYITELWPLDEMSREQKLNAITRLVILLTLAGFVVSNNYKIVVTGIVSLFFLIITYKVLNNNNNVNQKTRETFSNETIYDKVMYDTIMYDAKCVARVVSLKRYRSLSSTFICYNSYIYIYIYIYSTFMHRFE